LGVLLLVQYCPGWTSDNQFGFKQGRCNAVRAVHKVLREIWLEMSLTVQTPQTDAGFALRAKFVRIVHEIRPLGANLSFKNSKFKDYGFYKHSYYSTNNRELFHAMADVGL